MQIECFDCQPRAGLAAGAQERPASAETGNTGSSLHADLFYFLSDPDVLSHSEQIKTPQACSSEQNPDINQTV